LIINLIYLSQLRKAAAVRARREEVVIEGRLDAGKSFQAHALFTVQAGVQLLDWVCRLRGDMAKFLVGDTPSSKSCAGCNF